MSLTKALQGVTIADEQGLEIDLRKAEVTLRFLTPKAPSPPLQCICLGQQYPIWPTIPRSSAAVDACPSPAAPQQWDPMRVPALQVFAEAGIIKSVEQVHHNDSHGMYLNLYRP